MEICDKIKYLTYKDAVDAIIQISKKSKYKMSSYKCDKCDGFHLTTINKKTLFPAKETLKYPIKIEDIKKVKIKTENFSPVKRERTKFKPATEKLLRPEQIEKLNEHIQRNSDNI